MYKNNFKNTGVATVVAVAAIVLLGITGLGNNVKADYKSGSVAETQSQPQTSSMRCSDDAFCLLVGPQIVHPLGFRGHLNQDNEQTCSHQSACGQIAQQNERGRNLVSGGVNFDD
ncbi:MAG TPA: hypothetical protein VH500_22935 [Nitrososphaeraceae archaeon]|jgi:hypothetical protein